MFRKILEKLLLENVQQEIEITIGIDSCKLFRFSAQNRGKKIWKSVSLQLSTNDVEGWG